MSVDISKLGASELEALQNEIEARKKELAEENKKAAISEAKDVADKYGLSIEELVALLSPSGAKAKSASGSSEKVVRFRDPDNPGNTWAGRGRKPDWLIEALDNGRELDEFRV